MANLSDIVAPSNVLTVDNTKTVSNKTINTSNNTLIIAGSDITTGTVNTARLATGTADSTTFLRGDGTWSAAGLTYFTDAEDATGVNASVPVNALIVANAGTNVDVALSPKGTGAVLAQIPDGTTTGGNKRGTYAVDWQTSRTTSAHVASGIYSTISGGRNNTASGNTATAGGYQNTASGNYSNAGGFLSAASSSGTTAFGYGVTATSSYATALGQYSRADGSYSTVVGAYGDARVRYNVFVVGTQAIASVAGTCQMSMQQVGSTTTDATPTNLSGIYVGNTYVYQNRMDVNSAYAFKIMLVAGVTGAGDTKAWELTGCIKRGASGVPTLVGAVTKTVIAADTGAATWDCDIVIDTDAFTVQATGQAATTIRWTASIYTAEMEY